MDNDGTVGKAIRFNLKFAFFIISNTCVLAWTLSAPSVVSGIVLVIFFSLTFALYGLILGRSPVLWGGLGGAISVLAFLAVLFVLTAGDYYLQGQPADYFEDGPVTLLIYPGLYAAFYGPIGGIIGLGCGPLVRWMNRLWAVVVARY